MAAEPTDAAADSTPASAHEVAAEPPPKQHRSTNSGRRRSSTARRRPKRARQPKSFFAWSERDQAKYREGTIELRRWKATQRQCSYIRQSAGQWNHVKNFFFTPPIKAQELATFKSTARARKVIPREQSIDLPALT